MVVGLPNLKRAELTGILTSVRTGSPPAKIGNRLPFCINTQNYCFLEERKESIRRFYRRKRMDFIEVGYHS